MDKNGTNGEFAKINYYPLIILIGAITFRLFLELMFLTSWFEIFTQIGMKGE